MVVLHNDLDPASVAISPLDGRYADRVQPLSLLFSEFALVRYRCLVEVRYALALDETGVFEPLDSDLKHRALDLLDSFGPAEFARIKDIESTLRHDVKACEVFLRERLPFPNPNRIHFGLTSEDVNNLAWSLALADYTRDIQLPLWKSLIKALAEKVRDWRDCPFPARTHGQHASPSTAGKEVAVLARRLLKCYVELRIFKFAGKINGAVGNYSAFTAAAPDVDWPSFSRRFVESLGLVFNPLTTQIEDHDTWADYFNLVRKFNNILIDLDQDFWLYISYAYFKQAVAQGEVGSSTMPHKVNPIRFENSEGNALLSNALLTFMSDKLTRSRMQRDLSDSTVERNMGVALGHHHLAVRETLGGLARVALNEELCRRELEAHPELLAEPVQTLLRTVTSGDPYSELKKATRGQNASREELLLHGKTAGLDAAALKRLADMTPETYVGLAPELADMFLEELAEEVES